MSVFNRLIRPNGFVRVEVISSTDRDDSGGPIEAYTVLEDNIPVLISQISAARDGRFDSRIGSITGTVTGDSPSLGRTDTRLYFTANTIGTPAGVFAEVLSATSHGSAGDRLLGGRWWSLKFSTLPTPGG